MDTDRSFKAFVNSYYEEVFRMMGTIRNESVINPTSEEIEEVIRMLDSKTEEGVSRIGVHRVETEREDFVKEVHHHGRCDVGSPFADGSVGNFNCC